MCRAAARSQLMLAPAEELLQTRHEPHQPCSHIVPILFWGPMEKIQPSAPDAAAGRRVGCNDLLQEIIPSPRSNGSMGISSIKAQQPKNAGGTQGFHKDSPPTPPKKNPHTNSQHCPGQGFTPSRLHHFVPSPNSSHDKSSIAALIS